MFVNGNNTSNGVMVVDPHRTYQHHHAALGKQLNIPTWRHFVAAGSAAAVSAGLYNSLDCLRIRWQVQGSSASEKSVLEFGSRIVRQEGLWQGLWRPGISANITGMAFASAMRFGYYEMVRDGLSGDEKEGHHMVLAGLLCGASAYCITTPFHLIKTQVQAQTGPGRVNNYLGRILKIVEERGAGGLWKGSLPLAARGGLFTAGQMLVSHKRCYSLGICYDGVKTMLMSRGLAKDGFQLHILASISASFGASILSAPADFIMSKYMNSNKSLLHCMQTVYIENGLAGFWRGWPIFFFRLTPVMLTYSTIYEQLRCQLGLGYFS